MQCHVIPMDGEGGEEGRGRGKKGETDVGLDVMNFLI